MSNQFLKLRRSAVPGRVPSTSSIDFGEIALNTFDGLAFIKRSGSNGEEVITLGSREGAFTGSFSGSFVGNGAGLFNVPASGIVGLNLSQIATGSVTASVGIGASSFNVVSGSSTFLYVSSSGNVGIATNTPSYKLTVAGSGTVAAFAGSSTAATAIQVGGGELGTLFIENQTNGGGSGINIYTQRGNSSFNIGYRTTSGANGGPINIGNLTSYAAGNINFLQNGSTKLIIDTSGNVGINTTSPTAKLDVSGSSRFIGNMVITGSGNTSATNALTVQNSDGTSILRARNDGAVLLGTALTYTNVGSRAIFTTADEMRFSRTAAATDTSGVKDFFQILTSFSPTSGTAQYNFFLINTTVNQTGGANGITRGLYVNPNLTAATDFRAIETTAGNVLFGSSFIWNNSTNLLRINGGIGVNRDATGGRALDVSGSGIRLTGAVNGTFEINGNNASLAVSTVGGIAGINIGDTNNAIINMTGNSYTYRILANASLLRIRDANAGDVDRFAIHSTGNVGIGFGSIDPTVQFGVSGSSRFVGNMVITGSGNNSATNALTIVNSSNSALLTVRNDGYVSVNGSFFAGSSPNGFTISSTSISSGLVDIRSDRMQMRVNSGPVYVYNQGDSNLASLILMGGRDGANTQFAPVILGSGTNASLVRETMRVDNQNQSVLIGTVTNVTSSILTLNSTSKGFLTPRMTEAQRLAITTPAQGLIVYDTGSATEGLWLYNSGSTPGWQQVLTNSGSQSISGSITVNNVTVTGTLTAQTIVAQTITSSTDYVSGSTIFGNSLSNTHQFTGSVSITGSLSLPYLTNGSVLFVSGGSISQNNSNFFWDNTNGRLGIGTAIPSSSLEITATSAIGFTNKIARVNKFGGANIFEISNQNKIDIFRESNTDNGYEGIFIHGPFPNTFGANNNNKGIITFINNNGAADIYSGIQAASSNYGNTRAGVYFVGGNSIRFVAGSTVSPNDRNMFFSSVGNLSIGSTSDNGQRLQVYGTTFLSGSVTGSDNVLISKNQNGSTLLTLSNTTSGTNSNAYYRAVSSNGYLDFGRTSASSTTYKIIVANDSFIANGTTGDLAILNDFATGNIKLAAGGSSTPQMFISSSGNVGIGTNAPLGLTHIKSANVLSTGLSGAQLIVEGFASTILQLASFNTGFISLSFGDQDDGNDGQIIYSNASRYMAFEVANSERMRIHSTGNISIGTTSDLSVRLGVVGDTLLRGSGNTSATTALTVQDSASSDMLRVRSDSRILIGGASTTAAPSIYAYSGITGNRSLRVGIQSAGSLTPIPAFNINQENDYTYTTGTGEFTTITANFLPTSGTGTLAYLSLKGTINQTGGANGITRGLYVNPTLTSTADFRAIEWSNNVSGSTSWGLYGAGTAPNFLNGNLGIGTTSLSNTIFGISKNIIGGGASTSAYSIFNSPQIQSDVTNIAWYNRTIASTQNTAFTLNNLRHYAANQGTFGASSVVTNQLGFHAESTLIGATNNYGFYGDIPSGTGRWNIFMNGTADNFLAGKLGIGTTSPSKRLEVHDSGSGDGIAIARSSVPVQRIEIIPNDATASTLIKGGGNNKPFYIASWANGGLAQPLYFGTNYTSGINEVRMTIDATGSVGIGTITPTTTLDVRGNTFISGTLDILDAEINYQRNNNVTTGSARLIASIPTGSLNAAFFDYVIVSGSNARAGTVSSVWASSSVEWNETYTNDIGSTTDVSLYAAITGSSIGLFATSSINNTWTIKSLIRTI